jgi:hypothetical protein
MLVLISISLSFLELCTPPTNKHDSYCNTESPLITADTMDDGGKDLGSLFMRLPTELRIDIYERILNASLDNSLLSSSLDHRPMQKAMLRILHINRNIRNESQDIFTKLAKRHIETLEADIGAENITCMNIINISISPLPAATSPRFQPYWARFERLAGIADKISYDANKLMALYGLLRILHVPLGGRLNVPWLDMLRRLHFLLG